MSELSIGTKKPIHNKQLFIKQGFALLDLTWLLGWQDELLHFCVCPFSKMFSPLGSTLHIL